MSIIAAAVTIQLMKSMAYKLMYILELVRIEQVGSAVSNIWLVLFFSVYLEPANQTPLAWLSVSFHWAIVLSAAVALGLVLFGVCINDVLDIHSDETFAPQRPIPAGRVTAGFAMGMAAFSVLMALCAAAFLGQYSSVLCAVTAVAILFYNTTLKFLPATGIIVLGLIRVMMMLIVCPTLSYTWPVIIAMVHVNLTATIAWWVQGKRPRLTASDVAQLCAGTVFWALLFVGSMVWRETLLIHNLPMLWIGPILAIACFSVLTAYFLKRKLKNLRKRRSGGMQYFRLASLWLILYDAAWLVGIGELKQASWHGVLLLGTITMMFVIRCFNALSKSQPAYRIRHAW